MAEMEPGMERRASKDSAMEDDGDDSEGSAEFFSLPQSHTEDGPLALREEATESAGGAWDDFEDADEDLPSEADEETEGVKGNNLENLKPFERAYVQQQFLTERDKSEMLTMYVPFLFTFVMVIFIGRGVGGYEITKTLFSNLIDTHFVPDVCFNQKQFDDMSSPDDYWTWFKGPLLHGLWGADVFGEDRKAHSHINGAILPFGAIKLRQVRGTNDSCREYDKMFTGKEGSPVRELMHDTCAPFSFSYGKQDMDPITKGVALSPYAKQAFKYREAEKFNAYSSCSYGGRLRRYDCAGFGLFIPYSMRYKDVAHVVGELQNNTWIDFQTRAVFVQMFFYTPNLFRITHLQIVVEFSVGGALIPQHELITLQLFSWNLGFWYFFWHAGLLTFTIAYSWKLLRDYFRFVALSFLGGIGLQDRILQGLKAFTSFFTSSWWNAIDAANVGLLVFSWWFKFDWWAGSPTDISDMLEGEAFPRRFEGIARTVHLQEIVDSFNGIVCVLRLMYYLKLNTTFNVLTAVFMEAGSELMAVGVLATLLFFCFVAMGYVYYGHTLWGFSKVEYTTGTLLRMLVGSMEYEEMRAERRTATGIFCGMFVVSILFILLNLIIGVLAMALGIVRQRKFDSRSLRILLETNEQSKRERAERKMEALKKKRHLLKSSGSGVGNPSSGSGAGQGGGDGTGGGNGSGGGEDTNEMGLPQQAVSDISESIKHFLNTKLVTRQLLYTVLRIYLWFKGRCMSRRRYLVELERLRNQTPEGYWRTVFMKITQQERRADLGDSVEEEKKVSCGFRLLHSRDEDLLHRKFQNHTKVDVHQVLHDRLKKRNQEVKKKFVDQPKEQAAVGDVKLATEFLDFLLEWIRQRKELANLQTGNDEQEEADREELAMLSWLLAELQLTLAGVHTVLDQQRKTQAVLEDVISVFETHFKESVDKWLAEVRAKNASMSHRLSGFGRFSKRLSSTPLRPSQKGKKDSKGKGKGKKGSSGKKGGKKKGKKSGKKKKKNDEDGYDDPEARPMSNEKKNKNKEKRRAKVEQEEQDAWLNSKPLTGGAGKAHADLAHLLTKNEGVGGMEF